MRIRSSVVALIVAFVALGAGSAYVVGNLPEQAVSREDWRPPEPGAQPDGETPEIADNGLEVDVTDSTSAESSDQETSQAQLRDITEDETLITSDQPASGTDSTESPESAASSESPETVQETEPKHSNLDGYPGNRRIYGVMTRDGEDDEIADFIQAAGYSPSLIGVTAGWARDGYALWYTERIALKGAIPMISWEPWDAAKESSVDQLRSEQPDFSLARILDGDFDDYIDDWADGLADWGHPVMLRFAHEMNGYWYPWADGRNGNQTGDYAATWRYIHDRFADAGADNVIWVWSPNVAYTASTPLPELYPGDDYVDWVGVVGYYGHFSEPPTTQPGFDGIFGPTLDRLEAITDKPVFITETGAGPYGQLKADWITDAVDAFANDPRVGGFVWFNVDKEFNWRVDSSPEALTAFRAAIADPAFGATKATGS